jgi:hypothetical protein
MTDIQPALGKSEGRGKYRKQQKTTRDLILELLKEYKNDVNMVATALTKQTGLDETLRRACILDYVTLVASDSANNKQSRRREGPHRRSPVRSAERKTATLEARQKLAKRLIFDRQIRGGGRLGDLRMHELRALAQMNAQTATSFLMRGVDDAVEAVALIKLSQHTVSADPFARVEDVFKAEVVATFFEQASLDVVRQFRDTSANLANSLVGDEA